MDIVLRESERLNTTIRSFLAYARPQRFADRAVRRPARAERHGAAAAQQRRGARRPRRSTSTCRPTELWYEADEGQIKQIVWNLATNGLRAMPDGGRLRLIGALEPVERRRRAHRAGRRHRHPAEELDGLFQPFHGTLREGQRPRPRHRPPHRDRLQRRDSGQLAAGRGHDGVGPPAGARGGRRHEHR